MYDGYCSDSTIAGVADRRRQRRRNEACQSFTCMSPWFIVRRWITRSGKSGGSRHGSSVGRNWGMERKTEGEFNGLEIYEPQFSSPDVSEIGREASFNLGVGFGLIYLVAASRNELNKMVELHKEIETLLRSLHKEFRNQDKFEPLPATSSSSFSNTAVQAETRVCTEENHSSAVYSSSHDIHRIEKHLRMDRIEAEFDSLNNVQTTVEEESAVPEWSLNNNNNNNEYYYSVPARELERKLHELLETRQQERIKQLETLLDGAVQQLGEKERELSWWKDTARLIARHLPPVPNQVKVQGIHGGHGQGLESNAREMSRSMAMNSLSENVGGEF